MADTVRGGPCAYGRRLLPRAGVDPSPCRAPAVTAVRVKLTAKTATYRLCAQHRALFRERATS